MGEMGLENGAPAAYTELDADGAIRAALRNAPPYMLAFYNLLKSSHDTNAATNTTNASALAYNSRALAENSRMLSSLISHVDAVEKTTRMIEKNQQGLSDQHDADLAAVRANVSQVTAAHQESLNQRSLEDLREIVDRGIPLTVQHEPLQLATALLTILKLPLHMPLVVGWRSWNPPAHADRLDRLEQAASAPAAPTVPLRALLFTLASPAARDDVLRPQV